MTAAAPGRDQRGPEVPVVGIGASAGGVDALKDFFTAVPPDPGVAFVVVQHLEPSHESRMAEILGKCTLMGVSEAVDGQPIEAGHVYTNPSGAYVSLHGGRLAVAAPREGERVRLPIDFFLASLAEEQGERGIGVILSGASGTDGMRGVRAVREAGGMCMAQDPQEALFPAMPQSAIATGFVDSVLPAGLLPAALLSYVRGQPARDPASSVAQVEAAPPEVEEILELLRERVHRDFRYYRRSTIARRLQRRVGLTQTANLAAYLVRLRADEEELARLAQDMLIGVSAFFRDREAFEELEREVIAPLSSRRAFGAP